MSRKIITIYDIANETGFSAATVSKALNNYKGVNPKTKEIILNTGINMGYTPNSNARALITKKSWMIGVVFSEDLDLGMMHPHFSAILQSFRKTVEANGYDVLFLSQNVGNNEVSFVEHCRYRGIDGAMVAAGSGDSKLLEQIQELMDSEIKTVSVEKRYANNFTVISDNKMGSFQALEYLYFLGHRKIAHIAAPLNSIAGEERYSSYLEFLKEKQLEFNPKYVVEVEKYQYQAAYKAVNMLIDQCLNDMPTAIFAAYDEVACGTIARLIECGFRVPTDISVIGFDDVCMTNLAKPELTTIRQDRDRIGYEAAEKLLMLIEGKEIPSHDIRLPTTLVIRNSCSRIADT